MRFKKTALVSALGISLGTGITTITHAAIIDATWSGLVTVLDPTGGTLQNWSSPYYADPTWGYGYRTQVSGTLHFNTSTGAGSATLQPFEFFNASSPAVFHDMTLQAIGNGAGGPGSLVAGRMQVDWSGEFNIGVDMIFDAAGFFGGLAAGARASTTVSGVGAIPASNGIRKGNYPIGPVPLATTSFDTDFYNDPNCVLNVTCITGNDGIGGSPLDNGPFPGFNINLDIVSLHIMPHVVPIPTPIPVAAWLFGSGLLGLVGIAYPRKQARDAVPRPTE